MIRINIVNGISFFRLFSAPIVLWMILEKKIEIAFWIFTIAALSDLIDGYLARKLNLSTNFGQLIDPLSDKVLVFSVFVTLTYINLLATPIIIIIISRDFIILIGIVISLLLKKKISYTPLKIGKITFFFQALYAGMLLCNFSNLLNLEILIKYFGLFVIYITLLSGILYLIRWFQEFIQTK